MKLNQVLGALSLMLLIGCASNQSLIDTSIQQAEALKAIAAENKADSAATVNADQKLSEAITLNEKGESDPALLAANESLLEYRLVFALETLNALEKEHDLLLSGVKDAKTYNEVLLRIFDKTRRAK
ncbi:MAG TPA: hypothetical protein GX724_00035 [Fibrobacter sp.]|nr:hypothetical protein [Fibrobacter sp.]